MNLEGHCQRAGRVAARQDWALLRSIWGDPSHAPEKGAFWCLTRPAGLAGSVGGRAILWNCLRALGPLIVRTLPHCDSSQGRRI